MGLLKYAILGLINRTPATGYDIAKEFDRGLANFWYATHSQIYPELRQLTEEGFITFEIDTKGDKLKKKLYTITEEGRRELKEWLSVCDELEQTPKDIFRLKLYFLNELNGDDIKIYLEDQLDKRKTKLKRLEKNMSINKENSDSYGKIYNEELGDFLVLAGAIMREKNYIKWIEFCMDYVKKWTKNK